MQNREVGKTYPKSPMGGSPKATVKDAVYKKKPEYVSTEKEKNQRK